MRNYFFYTDPAKLNDQFSGQEFGPSQTGDPSQTGEAKKDKYRITNLHNGSSAPVIAVCNGTICVQPDDGTTYTIILKPDYQPPFDFPYIKYFIYKGVKRESLKTTAVSNEITTAIDIPFAERIRDSWEPTIGTATNPISESADVLGLTYTLAFPTVADPIFENDDPIDNFFYYPNPKFQLPQVKAGDKIGLFENSNFGFEIVLERLGYEPKIALARTKVNEIAVETIADPLNNNSTWQVDEADYFVHWHDKEESLNYIDPCAFYGSFYANKVFISTGAGDKDKKKKKEIYTDILDKVKFVNRNKIYLDIRNDYGYSLNYYKDYGEDVQFVKDTTSLNLNTKRSLWPIQCIEQVEIAVLGTVKNDILFTTQLRLPHNENNNVPLVYLSKAYVKNFRRLKRRQRVQTPSKTMSITYLEAIDLAFVSIEENSNDVFVSNYYKLNLYDKDRDNNPKEPPLTPSKKYYMDGLFRPLDLKQNLIIKDNSFRFTIWHSELLVSQTGQGGPEFIAQVGIAEDLNHVTLFAFPHHFVRGDLSGTSPNAFTSWATQSKESKKMFLQEIFGLFSNKRLTKQELELVGSLDKLDTVVVENAPFNITDSVFRENENPEDYVFIMFDKSEYNLILTSLNNHANLPENLAIYLKKDQIETEPDNKGVNYSKLRLDASSFRNTSGMLQKENIDINKEIFEYVYI